MERNSREVGAFAQGTPRDPHRSPPIFENLDDAVFRTNPAYELVLFERLPAEQQDLLRGLEKDPELFGIARPRERLDLTVKSICRNTALLLFTLREPGAIPCYVRTMLGESYSAAIAELVLDGLLEVEHGGSFSSGASAYPLICQSRPETGVPGGMVAQLSVDALKYAQALDLDDSVKLSARLYFYNRRPVSPEWKRKLPAPEAVAEYLGAVADGPERWSLGPRWSQVSLPPGHAERWIMWRPARSRPTPPDSNITYKLYVSPTVEHARDAFRATIDVIGGLDTRRVKVGKDVHGLMRPDKLVAYFWSAEEVHEAAKRLRARLDGCPAHGVPFTAEIGQDGLLSWGVDPPHEEHVLELQERESWRLWVTNRLAVALVGGKASTSRSIEPWRFALERLRLDGVDTETWSPTPGMWERDGCGHPRGAVDHGHH